MAKKRPKINLSQPTKPHAGDLAGLFATDTDVEQASGLQLLALRIDAIHPDPDQPRSTFPAQSLEELSESIRQDGVIQPIEVTEIAPNQYKIVHGERRWRAAKLAELETIPAVVRRRDYDEVTRFVRQLVENIQREDLNDVDRAAGLLHLRSLMQEELTAAKEASVPSDQPWGTKVSWAKVGRRLGYSRQRIHQLIKLLDLPEEIQEAVRAGTLSERETRIFQGLKSSQQRALYRAQIAGDIAGKEATAVARFLKQDPDKTVHQAIRILRQPPPPPQNEPFFDTNAPETAVSPSDSHDEPAERSRPSWIRMEPPPQYITGQDEAEESQDQLSIQPAGRINLNNVKRLTYIRQHLARIVRQNLGHAEREETLRLLQLVEQDVQSLIAALETDAGR